MAQHDDKKKKSGGDEVPINHVRDEDVKKMMEDVLIPDDDAPAGQEGLSISEEELASLCREHICPKCSVMEEAKEERLRALADCENLKKRLNREMDEFRKFAAESVLAELLPVLDNLDLALTHGRTNEACKDFVLGVEMTRKVFLDTLEKHGLVAVGAQGEEFDPNVHEAVGLAQNPDMADNTVAQMVQAGYKLKGRLLRPAKVMVNKLS